MKLNNLDEDTRIRIASYLDEADDESSFDDRINAVMGAIGMIAGLDRGPNGWDLVGDEENNQ